MKTAWLLWMCLVFSAVGSWAAAPNIIVPIIGPVNINEDSPSSALTFRIGDDDTAAGALTIAKTSSDTILLPLANIALGGSGSNRTVTITPALDQNGNSDVELIVSDGTLETTNAFTLNVAAQNDLPTISGTLDFTVPDSGDVNLYTGITVGDVDHDNPASEELYLTLTVDESAAGTFDGLVDGLLARTGTPAVLNAAIHELLFTPYENTLPVGSSELVNAVITVSDSTGPAVSANSQVSVESENNAPVATLDVSPSLIDDNITAMPFGLTIDDPDLNESFSVKILAANDPANELGTFNPDPVDVSGTRLIVQNSINTVRYIPNENVVSGSTNVEFMVIIADNHGSTVTNAPPFPFLTIRGVNDAPSIRGVFQLQIRIDDDETVQPFATVVLEDPEQDPLTVTLSVGDGSLGTLDATTTNLPNPTAAMDWIRNRVFTPAPNAVAVGDVATVSLTITISDGEDTVVNSDTEIAITGVNGAPVILNIPAIQPITVDPVDARPFIDIVIDDDGIGNLTMTIEIDDTAKGSLSNGISGVDGFTSFTGSLADINDLLTNLVFEVDSSYRFPPEFFGETVFTIEVVDELGNAVQDTLHIVVQDAPRNILVTRREDDFEPGSLRYALALAAHNDVVTFAFENSTKIRLNEINGVIVLQKHLTIKGPGADKLIISGDTDGDMLPDTQLFQIESTVVMEGIAMEYGAGQFGGAVSVGALGDLSMRYCSVSDSIAQLWGGAIDVDEGRLFMENCLLRNNATDASQGLGGGAVSLYTDKNCVFVNTTFSRNRQASGTGFGGGAMYVENLTSATYLDVDVVHCTFAENEDAVAVASSVYANGFGSTVWPMNTIFADGLGYNLEVAGAGDVITLGGNISDDSTYTALMQGGTPQNVFLLDAPSDQTSVGDVMLDALADLEGPTAIYPLNTGSPAVDAAVSSRVAIDQRGVVRHSMPDCGAYEYGELDRIVINEIQPNDDPDDFIEFYIPRDSVDMDLTGYKLYVDGTLCHEFTNTVVKPGAGIIVADSTSVIANGPPPTPVVEPSAHSLDLGEVGAITLAAPGSDTNIILYVTYNDAFLSISNVFDNADYPTDSQTLLPQFCGFAYLPHGFVGAGTSSAGFDTAPQAFGSPNASAVAVDDQFIVSEDELSWIDVLANDVDADRTDTLIVTGVPVPNQSDVTTNGALYSVNTNAIPLPDGVWYNPLAAPLIQELAEGVELEETFSYSIMDMGTGTVAFIENVPGSNLLHTVEDHRLTTNDAVVLYGTGPYDGTNLISGVVDDDTVVLGTAAAGNVSNGVWIVFRSAAEADVELTVIGVNDEPQAMADAVVCGEEDVLRILGDPDLLTAGVVFETDADYPVAVDVAATNLLANDEDVDTDDDASTLMVVGVVGGNPLQTASTLGADVVLEIRDDRAETSIVYNPRVSSILNALATNEVAYDTFRYIVADSHGALGTGTVVVTVTGVNDTPVVGDDPGTMGALWPFVGEGESLADVIAGLTVLDAVSAASGVSGRMDARIVAEGYGEAESAIVENVWGTTEDDVLNIDSADILSNDSDVDLSDVLTVLAVSPSREGVPVSVINGNTTVQYNAPASAVLNALARGELLMDSFDAIITDGNGGQVTSTVAVLVTGVNDTPVARDDLNGTWEDRKLVFDPIHYPTNNPLLWDVDADTNGVPPDNAFWIVSVTNSPTTANGRFTITNNIIAYDPSVSAYLDGLSAITSVVDTFEYTLTDQSFVFACDDLFRVEADGTGAVLQVMANDRNYNQQGGAIEISVVGLPDSGGSVTLNGDGTALIYAPQTGFVGDEVFTYAVSDPWGNIDKARVTVRVTAEVRNGNIQANEDRFSAAKGELVVLDVLANDNRLPEAGAALTITQLVQTNGLAGRVQLIGNTLVYSNTNGAGTETFAYVISGGGTATAQAMVTVEVIDRDRKLPARNDCFSVLRDSVDSALDVLANDNILPDAPDISISLLSANPSYGTVSIDTNASVLRYSPDTGFVGVDEFEYSVSDGLGGTGYGRVMVFVGALTAQDDVFTVPANSMAAMLDVLANDSILPELGGTISIASVATQTVSIGTVVNNGNSLGFVPNLGAHGTETFSYTIEDTALMGSRTAQGSVTVTIADPGAYANADHFAVLGGSEDVTLNVLDNDASVGFNRTMVITGIGTGIDAPNQGGSVAVSSEGDELIYTPAAGFAGEETFTYSMTDSLGTDSAKVIIQVRPSEMAVCDDNYIVYFEGTNTPPFTLSVLLNDTLLPSGGGVLQIEGTGMDDPGGTNAPNHGGYVEVSADGQSLEYTPFTNYSGAFPYDETFTYEVSDGTQRRASALVSVRVEERIGGLELETNNDRYSVERNSAANELLVLLNDGILPATAADWEISGVGDCAFGGNAVISGSTILFTPAPDFRGTDYFTYSVSDGLGGTASATGSVVVGDVLLNEDCFAVISGSVSNEIDVLANDDVKPGPEFELNLLEAFNASVSGAVSVANGMLYYTPGADYAGTYPYVETVDYSVVDDSLLAVTQQVAVMVVEAGNDRDVGTVSMVVQGVNDPPVVTNLAEQLATDDKTPIAPFPAISVYDVDEWGDELLSATVSLDDAVKGTLSSLGGFALSSPGVYEMVGTGSNITVALQNVIFVPTENRITIGTNETTTLTVSVADPFVALPTTAQVDILVTPVNDVPVIGGTRANQRVYHTLRLKPFSSVTVAEVDDLTLQPLVVQVALDNASHGILTSLGDFTDLGGGVYSASNITQAAATTSLRGMVFTPTTDGRVSSTNTAETTRFTITVDDSVAPVVTDSITTVTAYFGLLKTVDSIWGGTGNPEGFGMTVGAARDLVAIGSPWADAGGAVTLFSRHLGGAEEWGALLTIPSPDATGNDEFGLSVALCGDTLVVGAPAHGTGGAAYVFQQNQGGADAWGLVRKLSVADGASGDRFGGSVAIDGDTTAVGAYHATFNNPDSGGVYLFERDQSGPDQWGQTQKIGPNDGFTANLFGYAVSLHGDMLVAGAPLDNEIALYAGAAYAFERDSGGSGLWSPVQKLFGDSAGVDDQFGYSVDIYEDVIAVGSPFDGDGSSGYGAAYVFSYTGDIVNGPWEFDRKLVRADQEISELFGAAVSVDRGILAVGVPGFGAGAENIGEVYAYGRNEGGVNQWGLIELFASPDGNTVGAFGSALSLEQYTLAVGSPGGRVLNTYTGSFSIFRFKFNNAPFVASPIADQVTETGTLFELTVPAGTFADPDMPDVLTLSAVQSNGTSLAATWLSFDTITGVFSGTPAVTGSVDILLIATDTDDLSATNAFSLHAVSSNVTTSLTAKLQWMQDHFGSAAVAAPAVAGEDWSDDTDFDKDNLSNIAEYVFGTNPTLLGDVTAHKVEIIDDSVPGQITLAYNRRTNDKSLIYILQQSAILGSWQDATPLVVSEMAVTLPDDMERVIVVLNVADTTSFFSVRVIY
ncbi:MAG: tandem-95 repeat protein [Kiritimatiellales bacterium]|nr:tandem-95 repeat protein [Kiritimatiellales bacterium]